MSEVNYIILLIPLFILIISLFSIFLLAKHNQLTNLLYKLDYSNQLIEKNLETKYNLIVRSINIIERKIKIVSKNFEEIKKINIKKLDAIELDKVLSVSNNEIIEIHIDYTKLSNVKSFNEIIEDLKSNELNLISLRTYYNKNVAEYNNLLQNFPNNIITKFKKLKLKTFYEGKELEEHKTN